ncbi:MAG: AAA family ATPase [Tissierellaceae bacterium]|nr:AAA family ATPase [Tissierellaceae bacterium]
MIIKEINLIGFGQFKNKVINLQDGINIVYGDNEAGKTTIHNFINGMFYGFLKPYARRTVYLDEHVKYAPWDNSKYAGIIKFTYDGKEYRIEREFARNNESTNVYLNDTGENITNSIDNGDGGRILQPGNHFFGFNDTVFTNTLFVKQLGNRTDTSLANEVREKLINVSNTLDDNLSIEKAIGELDKSIKDIGTIKATTSSYGKSHIRLEKLREKKESILKLKEEYDLLLSNKVQIDKELDNRISNINQLENRLDDAKILAKHRLFQEANSIKNEINDLNDKAKELERYANLSMEDYSYGIDLKRKILNIDEKIQENKNLITDIDNKIKELTSIDIKEDKSLDNIEVDYQKYEELEEERNTLKYTDNISELQFVQRDFNENIRTKNNLLIGIVLSIIASLSSVGLSIYLSNYLASIINIVTIPLMLILIYKSRSVKGLLVRIKKQRKQLEEREQLRKEKFITIDKSLENILFKYNVKTKLDLKRLLDKTQYHAFNIDQQERNIKENVSKKEDIIEKTEDLRELNQENKLELNKILANNSSDNFNDFKLGLEKKNIYEDTIVEINTKTNLLNRILGDSDLETLENEIKEHHRDITSIDEEMSVDELKTEINHKKEEISDTKIDIGRCEERINALNKEISSLVEIEEEISRIQDFLNKQDDKREALTLAKSTIEDLSKDIHRQFAPMINNKVGSIVEDITGGKYSSVKIDNSLEIGVINPDTQEIVNIENLSGGTIDQLYFSLRFGIVDSINNKGLPLILDDCFVQYDDNRLRNIMEFIYEKSKDKQIILFTCHRRENKILDEMKVEYNLINL